MLSHNCRCCCCCGFIICFLIIAVNRVVQFLLLSIKLIPFSHDTYTQVPLLVEKVHTSTEEFLTLLDHPLLVEEEQDHLQSIFNVLDQFESEKLNTTTVDNHYDQVEQQLKRTKREKIESEQSVKQACLRMMEQSEGEQSPQREQQLTDLLQSTTITKRDHLRSEYKQQLEHILTELEKKKQPFEQIKQAKKVLLTLDDPLQSLSNKTNEWKKQIMKPQQQQQRQL